MLLRTQQLYSIILLLSILAIHTECNHDKKWFDPVAVTPSGDIHGAYDISRHGRKFESYRGIRYAEPPLGDLRFQPPKLITKYNTPVDATRDGPVCPQPEVLKRLAPYRAMDEDCLTINVYTPLRKQRASLLPVIFFIHQSAFVGLTARSDIYGPHYLLDRDIVLVTFNYRLGSLGFISTGDKIGPGNNGFKDQVTALRWVQKNIAAFGGNPKSVTISGCSSGSISVVGHLISNMSKGLFHRAILMSGSPTKTGKPLTDQYHLAVKQAELLNCPTYNSTVIIECLKKKPWKDIANSYINFFLFDFNPVHIWEPIVEKDFGQERFLTIDPIAAIKNGKINNVPTLISQNEVEHFALAEPILKYPVLLRQMNEDWDNIAPIAFLLPEENIATALMELRSYYLQNRPLRNDEESLERLGTLYGDSIVAYPVNRLVNLMCRHSTKAVWYLYFTYVGNYSFYNSPVTGKPYRAVHQDDTLYLFSQPHSFPLTGTTGGDALMISRLTSIWYNFARYGDPNPREDTPELKGLVWPVMTPDNRTYLQLSKDLTLHQNLKETRLQIWEQLYPILY